MAEEAQQCLLPTMGGNSNWVGTLVQILGFPILLPFYYCFFKRQPKAKTTPPSFLTLLFVYVFLGLLAAGSSFLYSVGFKYLPVSTMTLILASQLAFNAFFSYFLNSQNFTPFIINSLVLLTTSSLLLVESDSDQISGENYATGFICTIFAAATCALLYASQQLAFGKFLKRKTFKVVMDVLIYRSLVAAIVILVGFFAFGDWKVFKTEMEEYEMGKVSYVMTLLWTAISYQMFFFGTVALIFEVSSLFSNVIGSLGLPINPIMAMFVFNDKMDYMKGISMGLAIWGVISYVYQQYLDNCKLNAENKNGNEVSNA
ncbi:hypothetical protein COLO4_38542 [Corchorus olitorius]|uniref:Probable purine permease n=1 Tax=Corchorus olitorius TaxID=93759 RepID=A0A1R3FUM4_9ROSI|nr:hypothetical protein COLO4_38542 [Corchorus olitorius]